MDGFERMLVAVRALPPNAELAREMRRLRRAEIVGSTALAGSPLSPEEIDALLDRGLAAGGRPLEAYLLVRAYANAAAWTTEQRILGLPPPRPLIGVDELRLLHAKVVGDERGGGAWRLSNPAPRERIVAPAPWLVPREIEALVDRVGRGPGADPIPRWIAAFIGRFARIRPFERGNGRVARLAANLMLRRIDVPPLVFERPERARYRRAVTAAEGGEPQPLAELAARALIRGGDRLLAVGGGEPLEPLPQLAGDDYTALAKAAQRGRLRTVLRGGRYFTTRGWIAAYRSESRP